MSDELKKPKCGWCGGPHTWNGCLLYIGAICGRNSWKYEK